MDLLERIFGVETMARAREAARETQSRALAQAESRPRLPQPKRPTARQPARGAAVASAPQIARAAAAGDFVDTLPANFPTSILEVATVATPPLLAAFASRDALLAAIVFSEALGPPLALREQPFGRR